MNTNVKKKQHKRVILYSTALIAAGATVTMGMAYALNALQVSTDILPAVGQTEVRSCDNTGVSVGYEYGQTNSKGIRVKTVNLGNIDNECTVALVEFIANDTVVSNASGAVSGGSAAVSPQNIFTDEFTSIRVSLMP